MVCVYTARPFIQIHFLLMNQLFIQSCHLQTKMNTLVLRQIVFWPILVRTILV